MKMMIAIDGRDCTSFHESSLLLDQTVRSSINDRDAFDEAVLQFDHPLDFDLVVKIDRKFICVD